VLAVLVAAALLALAGCSVGGNGATSCPSQPASSGPAPAAGSKLAPGLYDLEDGTVQAVGVVEYRDLEGGFWAVIGGAEAEGDVGKIVAVIANGADYAQQFKDHEGLSMIVTGRRLDGASTRMAGPEIEATSVVAASGASGPTE
jgi:hypothetical protein